MSSSNTVFVALATGTHTWEPNPSSELLQDEILTIMRAHGITRVDTASAYGSGASETTLGNKNVATEFKTTTKAPTSPGNGAGKRENVLKACRESLLALKVDKISVYLLHGPDETVPVEETYSAIQTLYNEGRFEKFGLSNFTRDQVLEYFKVAREHGYILPTVFQSSYSPAVRLNETLLFPTLRELGMTIQAYSPMAGGFLSRTSDELIHPTKGGKWDPESFVGRFYRTLFFKPSYLKFLDEWEALAEESGVSKVGLAYRWTRYHSLLRGNLGDEVIVGAGSSTQFEETVIEIEKGPLEDWVVQRIDALWEIVKEHAEVDNLRASRAVFG